MDAGDAFQKQYEQGIDLYKSVLVSGVQFTLLVLLGDVTATGFAVASHTSAFIIAATVLPLTGAWMIRRVAQLSGPFLYMAFNAETKIFASANDRGIRAVIGSFASQEILVHFEAIASIPDEAKRLAAIRMLDLGSLSFRKPQRILLIIVVCQLAVGCLLPIIHGWSLL